MAENAVPAARAPGPQIDLADDAYSLPSRYYIDPEILELEYERIFYRAWNFAGHISQLKTSGDYITCTVGRESIIVMVGDSGALHAFYNVCRHRGHWLLEGSGNVDSIICPYHAWRYATDGRLVYARSSEQVPGFDPSKFCLTAVRVEVFCGFVFVNLDPKASALATQVPGLEEEFRAYEPRLNELHFVHRSEFVIDSNWKNVVDNYNENYHTPVVHPVLGSILDESYRIEPKGKYLITWVMPALELKGGSRSRAQTFRSFSRGGCGRISVPCPFREGDSESYTSCRMDRSVPGRLMISICLTQNRPKSNGTRFTLLRTSSTSKM